MADSSRDPRADKPSADSMADPRVCAWCNRVKIDGVWQHAPVPDEGLLRVTHGICPDCRSNAEAVLDARDP